MSGFKFQKRTADAVLEKFAHSHVVALADEAGLGKTHVVIEIIASLAKARGSKPLCVFYVTSNLLLAKQNTDKLTRLLAKELGEDRVHECPDRITRLKRRPTKPGVHLVRLTAATSLTASSKGTKEEIRTVKNLKKNRLYAGLTRSEIRREIGLKKLQNGWMPDLLILDEYQTFNRALEWKTTDKKPTSLAPILIGIEKVRTLLVSATPFELQLPNPDDKKQMDRWKPPLSFEIFSHVLSGYQAKVHQDLLGTQSEYFRCWQNLLFELSKSPNLPSDAPVFSALEKAQKQFQAMLLPRVLRTYRSDLAQPRVTFENDLKGFEGSGFFKYLTEIHRRAHREKGWTENAQIFLSSLKFFDSARDARDQTYALGRGISSSGKRRLLEIVNELFNQDVKSKLLSKEVKQAGLNPAIPALWVSPSLTCLQSKKSVEKILIFSSFRSTPMEITERLKDLKKPRNKSKKAWYRIEEMTLFWPRPGWALGQLGASRDRQDWADEMSRNLMIQLKDDEHESKQAKKLFGDELKHRLSWEQLTQDSPGQQVLEALLQVMKAYRVPIQMQRDLFENQDILQGFVALKRAIDYYLGNHRSLSIMRKTLKVRNQSPANLVRNYCRRFYWHEVWVEYFDQLLGSSLERLTPGDRSHLTKTLLSGLKEATRAMKTRPTTRKRHGKILWQSHIAGTLGQSQSSRKKENRPEDMKAAFNSPFAPFVLSTTSVGEEGLDFHRYCRKQIHWDPPLNGSSLAQRIGRILRFRGLLQRKQFPAPPNQHGFIWKKAVKGRQKDGLIPNFQSVLNKETVGLDVILFGIPFTSQFAKAIEVKEHYADMKYFVGMTPEQLAQVLPYLVGKLSRTVKKRLAKYVIDLGPKPLTTPKPKKKSA